MIEGSCWWLDRSHLALRAIPLRQKIDGVKYGAVAGYELGKDGFG